MRGDISGKEKSGGAFYGGREERMGGNKMIGMIRGELLKMRHSTMGRSMWVMPVITNFAGVPHQYGGAECPAVYL